MAVSLPSDFFLPQLALQYMRHAVDVDPSYSDAYHQIGDQISGFDPSRAIALYRKSLAIDPHLEINHFDLGMTLTFLNRWDEARREMDAIRDDGSARLNPISTAFVESTINQVVSRRFVKKQQMQWKLKGAHISLQTRTKVLNNELEEVLRRWYPCFPAQAACPPTS